MKFLVTGGAGFIGSNIAKELLVLGHSVRIYDNFSTGRRENVRDIAGDAEIVENDIRDIGAVQSALKGVEIVLHQAALPSVPRSIKDPLTTHEVNVTGTLNVLEASVREGVKRVVFASSSSVYGNTLTLPKREDMNPRPLSPYAVSKLAGENYCQVFGKVNTLETVILRYFNVFGPGQDPTSQYAAVIPLFVTTMKANISPVIYGDGEQSRDFTYVSNVVQGNILAAQAPVESGTVMNCACGKRTSLNDLVRLLNAALGKQLSPRYSEERPGDVKHSEADISLAVSNLGYSVMVDFEDGIRKFVASG